MLQGRFLYLVILARLAKAATGQRPA